MQNIHHTPSRAGRAHRRPSVRSRPPLPPRPTRQAPTLPPCPTRQAPTLPPRPTRQAPTPPPRKSSLGAKRHFSTRSTKRSSLVLDPEQASDYILWDRNLRASYHEPQTRNSIDTPYQHQHRHQNPNLPQRNNHIFDTIVEEDETAPISPQSFPPRSKNKRSKTRLLQRWLIAVDRFVGYVKEKLDPEPSDEEKMAWKLRELEKEMVTERQRMRISQRVDEVEMRRQLLVAASVARAVGGKGRR